MFRRPVLALGALLGGFHGWLLVQQAWSGQLAEPGVILRWIAALALAGALVALARRGHSLFGRQAIAMWVLAALLHVPAVGNDRDGFATQALPEVVTSVAQTAAALSAVGLALLALFALVGWPQALVARAQLSAVPVAAGPLAARYTPGFLPRPPPRR